MGTSTVVPLRKIERDWNCPVIVAATGPSLTPTVAKKCRFARWFDGWRIIAVNDAYRLIPTAEILYACDDRWWFLHDGVPDFGGEKWSSHEAGEKATSANDKAVLYEKYPDIRYVSGREGSLFSTDQNFIYYGSNSGFQAVNLALLKGATRIVLVGFDMRVINGQTHFFGDHPEPLHNRKESAEYKAFIQPFNRASQGCTVPIFNATPGSALQCFPMKDLDEAFSEVRPKLYATAAHA